jgi:hypothetical protein
MVGTDRDQIADQACPRVEDPKLTIDGKTSTKDREIEIHDILPSARCGEMRMSRILSGTWDRFR